MPLQRSKLLICVWGNGVGRAVIAIAKSGERGAFLFIWDVLDEPPPCSPLAVLSQVILFVSSVAVRCAVCVYQES